MKLFFKDKSWVLILLNSSDIPGRNLSLSLKMIWLGTVFSINSSNEEQFINLSISPISSFLGPICLLTNLSISIIYCSKNCLYSSSDISSEYWFESEIFILKIHPSFSASWLIIAASFSRLLLTSIISPSIGA